jgi:hypothetical protein
MKLQNKVYEQKVAFEKTRHGGAKPAANVDLEDSLNQMSAIKGGGPHVEIVPDDSVS